MLLICGLVSSACAYERVIPSYPIAPTGYSSIKVFDNQGRFVGRILSTQRYWTPIERIPVFLRNALVAIEDSRFYEHNGIDVKGIARALMKDVVKGRMAEGGSTITQQLIKNKYLTGEKTLDRKLKEAQLAMEFEKKYSKDQILEMYFNTIYFGNGAWGVAQAARLYFDKNPEEMTDAECSLLAGIPKSPGRYNPLGKPADVNNRRMLVLNRMAELRMISGRQKQEIVNHPATVWKGDQAPSYVAHLRSKLVEAYGPRIVDEGGLDVISAMDLPLQQLAEKSLSEGVRKVSPKLQGALICLDPATGNVLAAVGGVDFAKSAYDRAFVAKRQPGSSIKPFIYADALENGFTAGSIMNDQPVAYPRGNGQSWKPVNYEKRSFGELTLREALAHSNNVIAVKLLDAVGVANFVNFAKTMGLDLHRQDLSLALGTEEVTLSQLVSAYTPFATGGTRAEARTIIRVYDRNRRSWTETPAAVTPALAPATAYLTTQLMKDVLTYGTAKGLKKFSEARPAAGKTGTTDDYRDAWFVGFTPQLITGVWVGYDQPKPGGRGFTGGAVSAPIWGRFMTGALAGKPAVDFPKPDNVVTATIDPSTGFLATPDCPVKKEEFYQTGTEPTQYCPKHGGQNMPPAAPAASKPKAPGTDLPLEDVLPTPEEEVEPPPADQQ
ncbi:MAG TPA: PBP1A family penicillin-binding protein [Geomonas sp.]|nr:PBP1A family penicillin-binding protein [Geomonas sp.]HJV36844.1 PBP1A family penicillin-binding protein [Geomonas sp.]